VKKKIVVNRNFLRPVVNVLLPLALICAAAPAHAAPVQGAPRAAWSGWEDLGGIITAGPAVASWSANRLDTFVKGSDNHMWHKWWDGSAWSGWEDLAGLIDDNQPSPGDQTGSTPSPAE
jgi:hypothetical protein